MNTSIEQANGRSAESLDCRLILEVNDREVVEELQKYPTPAEREGFALSALRVGVLAIRQAAGVIDGRTIREESERLVRTMAAALSEHTSLVEAQVSDVLRKYFDPTSGELPQRLDRLVRRDGELESLLARHVNGDGSTLSVTLDKHLGTGSPLLQALSPDQRKGILAALKESLEAVLADHGRRIAGQFSLDDKGSALSRLVAEVSEKNGSLRRDLAGDIEKVCKEFSLDNTDGALARLVDYVEKANRTILGEFSADNKDSALSRMTALLESTNQNIDACLSLDQEASPLSRLRRELLNVVEELKKGNKEFQDEVRVCLETMRARREEAARSTTHGYDFEDAVGDFVSREAHRQGDIFEVTKDGTGSIRCCKVGDYVVTLGPENMAFGYKIVVEAKEDKSYDVKKVLEELAKARENRQAGVGIFVISRTSAPDGIEPLNRWGQDLLVVWDVEDLATDIYFRAAFSLARLMLVQERSSRDRSTADVAAMESAVSTLTRDLTLLDEILKMANTVKNSGENITAKTTSLKKKIEAQLDVLREHIAGLGCDESA
jgi:hypothetical protein